MLILPNLAPLALYLKNTRSPDRARSLAPALGSLKRLPFVLSFHPLGIYFGTYDRCFVVGNKPTPPCLIFTQPLHNLYHLLAIVGGDEPQQTACFFPDTDVYVGHF